MTSKAEALEALKKKIAGDIALPLFGKANLVFGEGDPNAKIMFIGEAPGFYEDREMRPSSAGKPRSVTGRDCGVQTVFKRTARNYTAENYCDTRKIFNELFFAQRKNFA